MQNGTIIMINGTSSSGKTSILKALQAAFTEPYLDAGIDRFVWMLPSRWLNRPLWEDVIGLAVKAGPTGHKLFSGMHHTLVALSQRGNHVIADHVLVEPTWVRECAELLSPLPAYLIGLRCPLAILEQREIDRKDRTLGQARPQFEIVHAHQIYDLELDTSLLTPQESAQKIQERIAQGEPTAFRRLLEIGYGV